MLSATKVMNKLKEAGFIQDWHWKTTNGAIWDDAPPLWEKQIETLCTTLPLRVGNEVYGRKTMLYFYCSDENQAKQVAKFLRSLGGNPSFRWCPDSPTKFDMQVSYFKGNRWWE